MTHTKVRDIGPRAYQKHRHDRDRLVFLVRDIGPRAYQKHRHDRDRLVIMPRHRPICWQAIGPGLSKTHPARPVKRGLDPDKWFNNVEIVVGEEIGTETTTY